MPMNIEWWWIDVIVLLIILLAALRGAIKGIGDTIVRIASILGGVILGTALSGKVSAFLMTTKISTSLHDHIYEIIRGDEAGQPGLTTGESANPVADTINSTPADPVGNSISKSLGNIISNAADQASDAVADRLTEIAVGIIGFALILVAVALAAALIRALIRQGRKSSIVIGFTDRLLGMVLGAVRGLMIAWVAVALLIPVTTLIAPENVPSVMEALQQTTVAKVIYDVNPFLLIVRYILK